MRMMGQRLPPGVQDGDEADRGAEAFGGEGHERLGRRAHQETVDRLLVLEAISAAAGGRVKTTWK